MSEINSETPSFVITSEGDLHGVDSPENRELVRRIRACVNACEGISTTDLESGVITQMVQVMQDVQPLLESLNEQRPGQPLSKAS